VKGILSVKLSFKLASIHVTSHARLFVFFLVALAFIAIHTFMRAFTAYPDTRPLSFIAENTSVTLASFSFSENDFLLIYHFSTKRSLLLFRLEKQKRLRAHLFAKVLQWVSMLRNLRR